MPEVTDIEEVDGLYKLLVLDTLGHEFAVYFTESSGNDGYKIAKVRLPDGPEWNVDVFQEMIGVRDEAVEYLEDNGYPVPDASFDLSQVVEYDDDEYTDD